MKKTERPIITFPNGQTVCPLGQGTWKMGQSAARRHEEIRALQHGIELGMNLVDTAISVGPAAYPMAASIVM